MPSIPLSLSSSSSPAATSAVVCSLPAHGSAPWRSQSAASRTGTDAPPSPGRRLALLHKRLIASRLQLPTSPGPHRHQPLDIRLSILQSLVDSLIPRIAPHPILPTVQQPVSLRHVMNVRRCRSYAMYYSRLSVRSDVYLHPEVPLIPLLRLTHLRVSLSCTILRRRWRLNNARVHDRSLPKPQSLGLQMTVDLLEQTLSQLVLFQQMAEVQNRRLVRERARQPSTLRTASPTRPHRACLPYQDH